METINMQCKSISQIHRAYISGIATVGPSGALAPPSASVAPPSANQFIMHVTQFHSKLFYA